MKKYEVVGKFVAVFEIFKNGFLFFGIREFVILGLQIINLSLIKIYWFTSMSARPSANQDVKTSF